MAIKDVKRSMLVRMMNMSMSCFPISIPNCLKYLVTNACGTGASAQSVQAHARSERSQLISLPLKPLPSKMALCLIETLTRSATSLPAQKDQSVIVRILRTLQTLQMPQYAQRKGTASPTYKPAEVELYSPLSHWIKRYRLVQASPKKDLVALSACVLQGNDRETNVDHDP